MNGGDGNLSFPSFADQFTDANIAPPTVSFSLPNVFDSDYSAQLLGQAASNLGQQAGWAQAGLAIVEFITDHSEPVQPPSKMCQRLASRSRQHVASA